MEGDGRFAGFRIERELGRGGMGVVYLAEHVHLGRRVALKFLGPGLSESGDFRERFVRESRLAASLHHPNIVTVYDAGEAEGQLYIAMQYVDGTDLSTLLAEEGGSRRAGASTSSSRSPARSTPRTRKGSCTATSSPPTC